jgi:hypothetical protein
MRFHQVIAFLETEQLTEVAQAIEGVGFDGIYVSDHLCYPRRLQSRYPHSPYPDGTPLWAPETDWPDPWCLISALAAVTSRVAFTTGCTLLPPVTCSRWPSSSARQLCSLTTGLGRIPRLPLRRPAGPDQSGARTPCRDHRRRRQRGRAATRGPPGRRVAADPPAARRAGTGRQVTAVAA